MDKLPDFLITHYSNPKALQVSPKDDLQILCLKTLVNIFFSLDIEFGIEEILDAANTGEYIIGYVLSDIFASTLKIKHIEKLFESMVSIFNIKFSKLIRTEIYNLYYKGYIHNCEKCGRILLTPIDEFYYTICLKCDW